MVTAYLLIMDKDEIKLSDWQRILFGNAPLEFLIEVAIRTLFTYFILLIVIRLLGKRMSGQLTSTEMAVMLVLGAIVSVPMQTPDRGLAQGVFMLFLIMALQQGLTSWMRKNKKVEDGLQGTLSLLVKNGRLQLHEMNQVKMSREQLFAVLRGQQIYNLGQVKRMYLEACGDFSTYKADKPGPGLSILPRLHDGIHSMQQKAEGNTVVCGHCGNTENKKPAPHLCMVCGLEHWEQPVL
jgi:uncharacterized membrane protein YcaP (DUF421 family)